MPYFRSMATAALIVSREGGNDRRGDRRQSDRRQSGERRQRGTRL